MPEMEDWSRQYSGPVFTPGRGAGIQRRFNHVAKSKDWKAP